MTEKHSRRKGRGKNYSNFHHEIRETERRARKQKLSPLEGLITNSEEDSTINPQSTDMEPGKDYPIG